MFAKIKMLFSTLSVIVLLQSAAHSDECSPDVLFALLAQSDIAIVGTVRSGVIGSTAEAGVISWMFFVDKTEIISGTGNVEESIMVKAGPTILEFGSEKMLSLQKGTRVILFLKRPSTSMDPKVKHPFVVADCLFGIQKHTSYLEQLVRHTWARRCTLPPNKIAHTDCPPQ